MSRARRRALLVAAMIVAAALAMAAWLHSRAEPMPARPRGSRPTLLLLTSLPLVFSEDFSLAGSGSPALKALKSRYDVVLISVSSPEELRRGKLLLMVQPRAQPAEDLVALDAWVRAGGRVLLLADPMLEWPSRRPLGDPLRPPIMFPDTGLLGHWGLRLDAPDERGPEERNIAGYRVIMVSPGVLGGECEISSRAVVAECRPGAGRAIIVADADFLDVGHSELDGGHNLDGLLAELARLERK
ncbi:hypothetical protein ACUXST_001571 [Sphingomonas sp. F9_3S_D5_B_2]